MKRYWAIMLAVILILNMVPCAERRGLAESEKQKFALKLFDDGTAHIIGFRGIGYNLVELDPRDIPDGYVVTAVAPKAFYDGYSAQYVVLPEGVVSIGEHAFDFFTSLKGITLPSTLRIIENDAFARCFELESAPIPNGVTDIGDSAFEACENLRTLTLPDTLQRIGQDAFKGCHMIKSTVLHDDVASIGSGAFSHCNALGHIDIPGSLTHIEDKVFYECISLRDVIIREGVTSIGKEAFAYCISLNNIILPASVTSIERDAFVGCGKFLFTVIEGSYAHTYAITNRIPYTFGSAAPRTAKGDEPEVTVRTKADIHTDRLRLYADNLLYQSMISDPEAFFLSIGLDAEYNQNAAWSVKEALEWLLQADISDINITPQLFWEMVLLDMLASNVFSDGIINEETARDTLFQNVCAFIFDHLDMGMDMATSTATATDLLDGVNIGSKRFAEAIRKLYQTDIKALKLGDFSAFHEWMEWQDSFAAMDVDALEVVGIVLDTCETAYDAVNMVVNHIMILDRANSLKLVLQAMRPYCTGNLRHAIDAILASINGTYLHVFTSGIQMTGETLLLSAAQAVVSSAAMATPLAPFLAIRELGGLTLNALNNSNNVREQLAAVQAIAAFEHALSKAALKANEAYIANPTTQNAKVVTAFVDLAYSVAYSDTYVAQALYNTLSKGLAQRVINLFNTNDEVLSESLESIRASLVSSYQTINDPDILKLLSR